MADKKNPFGSNAFAGGSGGAKNPFGKSGRPSSMGAGSKALASESSFARKKTLSSVTQRTPFAGMKGKSSVDKMKMLYEANKKKNPFARPAPPKPTIDPNQRISAGFGNQVNAAKAAPTVSAPPPAPTVVKPTTPKPAAGPQTVSAVSGSGSYGGGSNRSKALSTGIKRSMDEPPAKAPSPFAANAAKKEEGGAAAAAGGGQSPDTGSGMQVMGNYEQEDVYRPTDATGKPIEADVSMTGDNYMKVYEEDQAAKKGALPPPQGMTAANYAQVYQKAQQAPQPKSDEPSREAITGGVNSKEFKEYIEAYKKKNFGFEGVAAQNMTGSNYTEVYKKQQEQLKVQEKIIQQVIKQQVHATAEARKTEQKNSTFAHQGRGLQAKLANLRGRLGHDQEQNRLIYIEIAETEAALAQIPAGLRG